jgi:hypothetical protein
VIEAAFWEDHGAQMILDATTLKDAIREGAKNGAWIYYAAEEQRAYTTKDAPPSVKFSKDCYLYTPERALELNLLGRALRWEDVGDVLAKQPIVDGQSLRKALETAIGKEPTKGEVLEVLSRAADGGESARVVVVTGMIEPGMKAATPAEIKKLSLDSVTILTPAQADKKSIQRPIARKTRIVESSGTAGVALQALVDRASDVPEIAGFSMISITAVADPGEGIKDLSLLGKAIAMWPKFEIDVATAIEMDFKGLTPGVEVKLTGPAKDYQRIEDAMLALAKVSSTVAGTLRLDIRFVKPAAVGGDEMKQLRKVLTDLSPGEIKLKGVLA